MNGAMRILKLSVTTTGSAGTATGSTTSSVPVIGLIHAVHLDFHASAPAQTILTVSNSATDAFIYPRAGAVNSSNAAITNSFVPFAVMDNIKVSLAQSDALTGAVVATIWYEEMN